MLHIQFKRHVSILRQCAAQNLVDIEQPESPHRWNHEKLIDPLPWDSYLYALDRIMRVRLKQPFRLNPTSMQSSKREKLFVQQLFVMNKKLQVLYN